MLETADAGSPQASQTLQTQILTVLLSPVSPQAALPLLLLLLPSCFSRVGLCVTP